MADNSVLQSPYGSPFRFEIGGTYPRPLSGDAPHGVYTVLEDGARDFPPCDSRARRAAPALRAIGQVWLFLPPRRNGYIFAPAIHAS